MGTPHGMAMRGPEHYKKAEDLLHKAEFERNETERAKALQEAQVHATLALIAATLQGGQVTDKQIRDWHTWGVRF